MRVEFPRRNSEVLAGLTQPQGIAGAFIIAGAAALARDQRRVGRLVRRPAR